MRLFLDANVLFSAAHNRNGNARALCSLADQGIATLRCSYFARDEAIRNIDLKFPNCRETLTALLQGIEQVPEPSPSLVETAMAVGMPQKDAPILAAALAARADIMVTGDKRHFGKLFGERVNGVVVLSPADALAMMLTRITQQPPKLPNGA
ncbi:MAG: PIN domain-containing protein [Candidatus Competibacteraceae bacterium]